MLQYISLYIKIPYIFFIKKREEYEKKIFKSIVIALLATAAVLPANLMHISAHTSGVQAEASIAAGASNQKTIPTTLDGRRIVWLLKTMGFCRKC